MLVPVLLVLLALLAAGVFAYGTEPIWASLSPHGLSLILWSRRLEWPLLITALLLCIVLLILVVSNKRRAWWLIGLLPVLSLFYHRFSAGPAAGLSSVQDPVFLSAMDAAKEVESSDLLVGIVVDSQPYAFRFWALHYTPVVVVTIRDKRVVLLWSEYANRALAFTAARDVRAEDLEIVCSPANALLVYNTRLGEFINGVTGRTTRGGNPTGFRDRIAVVKTTWQRWSSAHPDTKLAKPTAGLIAEAAQPRYAMGGSDPALLDARKVCVVACTQPIAVPTESITDHPLNLTSGQTSLLVVRIDGQVRAFNRELPGDLVPRFSITSDPKHKNVAWLDSDTNSEWSPSGTMVEGPKEMHGYGMTSVPVEDDLYWNVMKYWYPDLHFATDAEIAAAGVVPGRQPPEKPAGRRKKGANKS